MDDLRPAKSDSPLNQKVRAFIGIPAPTEWKDELARWTVLTRHRWETNRVWKKPPVSWTKPENYHITLRFFGSVTQSDLISITERLATLAAEVPAFDLHLANWVFFPRPSAARVVAIGLETQTQTRSLQKLVTAIEKRLWGFGQPPEKREFKPHLTLARSSFPAGSDESYNLIDAIEATPLPKLPPWRVEKISLIQSILNPGGSIYRPLIECPLGAGHSNTDEESSAF